MSLPRYSVAVLFHLPEIILSTRTHKHYHVLWCVYVCVCLSVCVSVRPNCRVLLFTCVLTSIRSHKNLWLPNQMQLIFLEGTMVIFNAVVTCTGTGSIRNRHRKLALHLHHCSAWLLFCLLTGTRRASIDLPRQELLLGGIPTGTAMFWCHRLQLLHMVQWRGNVHWQTKRTCIEGQLYQET